jgi:hypothetical protein
MNRIDDKEIIMRMGRDLLKYFLRVYNGPSSDVPLCYESGFFKLGQIANLDALSFK